MFTSKAFSLNYIEPYATPTSPKLKTVTERRVLRDQRKGVLKKSEEL